jgi:hypothetical protein
MMSKVKVSAVAPRAGAWIETRNTYSWGLLAPQSRFARARGLKLDLRPIVVSEPRVARRTRAWMKVLRVEA